MSLVVHKLMLSPVGTAPTATASPQQGSHHVSLAAYPHPNRPPISNGVVRALEGLSNTSITTPPLSSSSSQASPPSSNSSTSRSSYNLPFVLQDHNYGAPPPPTPPQSPPPSSSPPPYLPHHMPHYPANSTHPYTTHVQYPGHHQVGVHHAYLGGTAYNQQPPVSCQYSAMTMGRQHMNQTGPHQVGFPGMPLHRQHFMPVPHVAKMAPFPSPHIPPPPVVDYGGTPPGGAETDEDSRLSDHSSSVGPSGEETETAAEGEDDPPGDDSITRCVCDFTHDDGYMIQCDRCFVWQHVDCMGINRNDIPEEYLCEACDVRPVDRMRARTLQIKRRQEIKANLARIHSSDSDDNTAPLGGNGKGVRGSNSPGKAHDRKVIKKKKVKATSKKEGREGKTSLKETRTTSLVKEGKSPVLKEGKAPTTRRSSQSSNPAGKKMPVTVPMEVMLPIALPEEEKVVEKKAIAKTRRRKSGGSMSGGESPPQVPPPPPVPVERLRAWVEGYEDAVTNHYSQELRARVHAVRINGVSANLRASVQGAVLGHRCQVVENMRPLHGVFDRKVLVAATRLQCDTAVIEYQGKYLLSSQWFDQYGHPSQRFLPYVLLHYMPKEGLRVCVDARTYGNDARFVRRSCVPNAEVRHVLERGSLHLYLVALREIEEGEEISLSLDTANTQLDLVCCAKIPDHACPCAPTQLQLQEMQVMQMQQQLVTPTPAPITPPSPVKRKEVLTLNLKKGVAKKSSQPPVRSSKRTISSDGRSGNAPAVEASPTQIQTTPLTPLTPLKQRRASGCGSVTGSRGRSPIKSPPHNFPPEESSPSPLHSPVEGKSCGHDSKMTREERKIAAYMKAFERMEKQAQRKQEMGRRKDDDTDDRRREGGRRNSEGGRRRSSDGGGRRSSEEEASSTTPAVKGGMGIHRIDASRRKSSKKTRSRGTPQKRVRHASVDDESSGGASTGMASPSGGSVEENMSPLVGFLSQKFPKTKKTLMNEWLKETVVPVNGKRAEFSEHFSGVPTCYMRSPAANLFRRSVSANPSLLLAGTTILNGSEMPGGSAKKRWLRQAIIEELNNSPQIGGGVLCASPNSRPESPTGMDYIAPLKKRRLARESMSSEPSTTPPLTPRQNGTAGDDDEKMEEEMEAELADSRDTDEEEIDGKSKLDLDMLVKTKPFEDDDSESAVKQEWKVEEIKMKQETNTDVNDNSNLSSDDKNNWTDNAVDCADVNIHDTYPLLRKDAECSEFSTTNGIMDETNNDVLERPKSPVLGRSWNFRLPVTTLATVLVPIAAEMEDGTEKRCSPLPTLAGEGRKCSVDWLDEDEPDGILKEAATEVCSGMPCPHPLPTPVKKKLSILEYRKRKSFTSESDICAHEISEPSEAIEDQSNDLSHPDDPEVVLPGSPTVSCTSDDSSVDIDLSPLPHFPPGILPFPENNPVPPACPRQSLPKLGPKRKGRRDVPTKKSRSGSKKSLHVLNWDEAPTLLERQRENLSLRLKREFGLCLSDDEGNELVGARKIPRLRKTPIDIRAVGGTRKSPIKKSKMFALIEQGRKDRNEATVEELPSCVPPAKENQKTSPPLSEEMNTLLLHDIEGNKIAQDAGELSLQMKEVPPCFSDDDLKNSSCVEENYEKTSLVEDEKRIFPLSLEDINTPSISEEEKTISLSEDMKTKTSEIDVKTSFEEINSFPIQEVENKLQNSPAKASIKADSPVADILPEINPIEQEIGNDATASAENEDGSSGESVKLDPVALLDSLCSSMVAQLPKN